MQAAEKTRNLAKRLRRRMNIPETRLWGLLRANRFEGAHFRRQHPIGPYVLDFFCARAKLAVEVDGGVHDHDDRQMQDAARDAWLANHGIRTLHLPARLVIEDIDAALAIIRTGLRVLNRPT